jgi:outer membrane protein
MAYFEMDSVDKNYEYVQEIKENLRKKEESVNIQLNAMKTGYQKKIQEWQQKGQNMSQAESDAINREYQQMQMTYDTKQKQLSDDLESEKIKMLMDVHKKISEYLKEYNKTKGFNYIITDEQGLIYYKDTVYNITREVLAGLNAEYKSKGKTKKE